MNEIKKSLEDLNLPSRLKSAREWKDVLDDPILCIFALIAYDSTQKVFDDVQDEKQTEDFMNKAMAESIQESIQESIRKSMENKFYD